MGQIISITNQKGGVGKTTTSINLSASFSAVKRKVLLIDLDPQGNATTGSGVYPDQLTVNDWLLQKATLSEILVQTQNGYDLLPTNGDLTMAEVRLLNQPDREYQLKKLLNDIKSFYEFILIDCPPSLNMLTVNALVASDAVLIPIQCEYYALEGLNALLNTIRRLKEKANPNLRIEGLVRTMFDGRNRLTQEVSQQLVNHFGDTVYQAIIPRNVRLAEAPSHGLSAFAYDKHSQGSLAYLALAGEIIRKQQKLIVETVS